MGIHTHVCAMAIHFLPKKYETCDKQYFPQFPSNTLGPKQLVVLHTALLSIFLTRELPCGPDIDGR